MSQTIVRVYDSEAKAQQAVDALVLKGFGTDLINLVAPSEPAQSLEDIAAAIRAGYVLKGYAKAYAACVQRGLTVLSMRAPFGTGLVVTRLMDAPGPVASGVPEQHEAGPTWDEATPLSSALNLPVLAKSGTTFSGFWQLPMVMKEGERSRTLFSVNFKRGANAAPFSSLLGLPLLSKKWTFSSMLGLPLVVKSKR
ncbi:MAG: hypothetical protein K2Y51_19085 [Gammaproteobacteria bacterium]|jgi:hypothetical protein|nr:hypothetical protein [Gammaproteobacteria bacterium]